MLKSRTEKLEMFTREYLREVADNNWFVANIDISPEHLIHLRIMPYKHAGVRGGSEQLKQYACGLFTKRSVFPDIIEFECYDLADIPQDEAVFVYTPQEFYDMIDILRL